MPPTLVIHPVLLTRERSERSLLASLEEAVGLAQAIQLNVVHAAIAKLRSVTPATYLGKGKVEELRSIIEQEEIALAIVDCALTPIQQRNLEKTWNCKVLDRTALILEIFGARARTAEGKLQVELASLTYQKSRLVRSWTHLERQRGGFGFLGGPGESQIEIDRRLIGERIDKIKRQLADVVRTRELHRATRRDVPYPLIALVGYTNAGKSTLFNRLTKSDVVAQDMLFATLDPTIRQVKLPSGLTVLLSDTVGFISNLPTELIAAFRATLEEVLNADIILHIRDIAHDDTAAQKTDVEGVLKKLFGGNVAAGSGTPPPVGGRLGGGLPQTQTSDIRAPHLTSPRRGEGSQERGTAGENLPPLLEVHNKIDAWEEIHTQRYIPQGDVIALSAITGEGCDELLVRIDALLSESLLAPAECVIPNTNGRAMAWLYANGQVLARHDGDTSARFTVRLSPANHARFLGMMG